MKTVHTDRTVLTVFFSPLAVMLDNEALRASEFVFLLGHDDNILLFIGYFGDGKGIGVIVGINI